MDVTSAGSDGNVNDYVNSLIGKHVVVQGADAYHIQDTWHDNQNVLTGSLGLCLSSHVGNRSDWPAAVGTELEIAKASVATDRTGIYWTLRIEAVDSRMGVNSRPAIFMVLTPRHPDLNEYRNAIDACLPGKDKYDAKVAAEKIVAQNAHVSEAQRIKNMKRDVVVLSNWNVDKSQEQRPGVAAPIKATSRITGIDGATVEATMACQPDENSTDLSKTKVNIGISVKNASIDKSKSADKKEALFQLYSIQDDEAWSTQMKESLLGSSYCAYTVEGDCTDWEHYLNEPNEAFFSYWMPSSDLAATKKDYSIILSVDHGLVELRMNRSQLAFDSFLKSCNRLTPKQERLRRNLSNPQ